MKTDVPKNKKQKRKKTDGPSPIVAMCERKNNFRTTDDFWYPTFISTYFDDKTNFDIGTIQEAMAVKYNAKVSMQNVRSRFRTAKKKYITGKFVVDQESIRPKDTHVQKYDEEQEKNKAKGPNRKAIGTNKSVISDETSAKPQRKKRKGTIQTNIFTAYINFMIERKCYVNPNSWFYGEYIVDNGRKNIDSQRNALYTYLNSEDGKNRKETVMEKLNLSENDKIPNGFFYITAARAIQNELDKSDNYEISGDKCWNIVVSTARMLDSRKGTTRVNIDNLKEEDVYKNLKKVMKDFTYSCIKFENDKVEI